MITILNKHFFKYSLLNIFITLSALFTYLLTLNCLISLFKNSFYSYNSPFNKAILFIHFLLNKFILNKFLSVKYYLLKIAYLNTNYIVFIFILLLATISTFISKILKWLVKRKSKLLKKKTISKETYYVINLFAKMLTIYFFLIRIRQFLRFIDVNYYPNIKKQFLTRGFILQLNFYLFFFFGWFLYQYINDIFNKINI